MADNKQGNSKRGGGTNDGKHIGDIVLRIDCNQGVPCTTDNGGHGGGEITLYMDDWVEKTNRGKKYTVPAKRVITMRFDEEFEIGSEIIVYVRKRNIHKEVQQNVS